jgi:alkylhydroperoxidase/carboxymuconolactone decarboxylase family protein YurZ
LVQSILIDTYGRVLSDTSIITIAETELCLVATLVPLNVPPQLKSHVYGSRNVGVPMEQVKQLVSVAEEITKWIQSQDRSSL